MQTRPKIHTHKHACRRKISSRDEEKLTAHKKKNVEKATKEAAQTKEKDDEKQKPFLQRIGADMNILREFQGGFLGG